MTVTMEQLQSQVLPPEERTRLLIDEGGFYEPNKSILREMFTAMGRADKWSEDPTDPAFIRYLREGLIGIEHGNSDDKDQFTPEEIEAAMPYFKELGLVDEKLPPANEKFARAFVGGATTQALYRRTGTSETATHEHGAEIEQVDIAAGQRPREARDGTNDELMSDKGRFAGNDIRDIPWVKRGRMVYHDAKGRFATRFSESLKSDSEGRWQITETDLARIALAKQVEGADRAHRINLALTDLQNPHQSVPKKLEGIPARIIKSYDYEVADGRRFRVMNAPAVVRDRGEPRPTTDSTVAEWLAETELPENAKVLFVTSNPHADRMAHSFHATLQGLGRRDVQVSVAATSAPANATPQLFLGEIARMIDNDLRDNYGVKR